MESKRLEEQLDDLYLIMNGPLKNTLANWHDVMFKVRVAKMGYITLTDKDIKALFDAVTPLITTLHDVYNHLRTRMPQ